MKKLILILIFAGTSLCLTGCQKESNNAEQDAAAAEEMADEMNAEDPEMQDATAGEEDDK
jgi:hypothetical protein